MNRNYTLVVCEKPDAAKRVADALSDGAASSAMVEGVQTFEFRRGGEDFVVCAAQGHVFAVSDPFAERSVYPVFDVEWYDCGAVEKKAAGAARRIATIKKLAGGASKFVNACDYDVEGETIGFNILRYACGGRELDAKRAKFSTLTKDELLEAFRGAEVPPAHGMADAGRARHLIDFVWGVNLSRALSQSAISAGHRYRTVSIGRVQGPTLGFVVEREREIRSFVPRPYWTARGVFEKDGERLLAPYSKDRLDRKADAEKVRAECSGREGTVGRFAKSVSEVVPPAPFNIGDLQREAYRAFGYSPSRTMQIAERLYLDVLISYPRTSSQKLPPSIDYRKIVRGLASSKEYSRHAERLLTGSLRPAQGVKDDQAHPAIHPTGESPRRPLRAQEALLYDLVAKRFLATFAPPAKSERVSVGVSVNGHSFKLGGRRTVFQGWLEYYAPYSKSADVDIPQIGEGERLKVLAVETEEKFESGPPRYNQSSLLEKMELEGIGTKATRADIIAMLVDRGYVTGESLTASDLGFSVVETMELYAPEIVSTGLTRSVEERLEKVEEGAESQKELVRGTVRSISNQLVALNLNEEQVGREIDSAVSLSVADRHVVGACPVCKTGKLRIIRSKKTGKRFVGCSNYSSGCRASAPLPQRGTVKAAQRPCQHCSWPVVYVLAGRSPWRLCVNPRCPSKAGRSHEV